jgi:hypothetical protein
VRKSIYAIVLGSLLIFSTRSLYAQDHGMHAPNAPEEKRAMPQSGGAMGGMMGHEGMGMMSHENMGRMEHGRMGMMMMHNPRLAAIMMQMRGEMMRIRGEAMMKEGDVLKRYGERLQKEGVTKEAPKTGAK